MMDKRSFVLGMVAAFCECVATGVKPVAFSPPLSDDDDAQYAADIDALVEQYGLCTYYEESRELPAPVRANFTVIYQSPDALRAYQDLRLLMKNPLVDIDVFAGLLGRDRAQCVCEYDAYSDFFPEGD